MGSSSSKKSFTEWDLIRFSNITGEYSTVLLIFLLKRSSMYLGVPLSIVEKIYKEFIMVTKDENKMEKKEFRRLYKEMYMNSQTGNDVLSFFSEHDLDKMSDHVFETYDSDGTGRTFLFSHES